jgi:hypothetical protein
MAWIKRNWLLGVMVLLVLGLLTDRIARAQTPGPFQFAVGAATHTSCTVTPSVTIYCFPSDGLWVSLNGAPFVLAQTGSSPVLSFNGRTGAVMPLPSDYPALVSSVNGKTGSVVITATTTVQ